MGPVIRCKVLATDIRIVRNRMVVRFTSSSILRIDHLAQLLLPLLRVLLVLDLHDDVLMGVELRLARATVLTCFLLCL